VERNGRERRSIRRMTKAIFGVRGEPGAAIITRRPWEKTRHGRANCFVRTENGRRLRKIIIKTGPAGYGERGYGQLRCASAAKFESRRSAENRVGRKIRRDNDDWRGGGG